MLLKYIPLACKFVGDPMERFFVRLACVASCVLLQFAGGPASARANMDRLAVSAPSTTLDMGVQPLSYPNGVIGAVMRHDRILQAELTRLGTPLRTHAFKSGADMLAPIGENKLHAGLIGDMPTAIAASTQQVWIVGLTEVSQNAIVTRGGASLDRGLCSRLWMDAPVTPQCRKSSPVGASGRTSIYRDTNTH